MGLFANLRKGKSDFDDSDDWLLDLQEEADPAELELPAPTPSPSPTLTPNPNPNPTPSLNPTPPPPPGPAGIPTLEPTPAPEPIPAPTPTLGHTEAAVAPQAEASAWHLPDLDPEAPNYEPIDFGTAEPLWSDSPPTEELAWDTIRWVPEATPPAWQQPADPVGDTTSDADSPSAHSPSADSPSAHSPSADSPSGGPDAPGAGVMLEILGLFPGASWAEVRDAHRELIEGHRHDAFTDPAHARLAEEIRREMNTACAALRLMAASH